LPLEIGLGIEAEVQRVCREAGLDVEQVLPDLKAIPRVVVGRALGGAVAPNPI